MTTSAVRSIPRGTSGPDLVTLAATLGAAAAGAALFEAALVPGIVLGAAALFAPDLAARHLPKLGRGLRTLVQSPATPVPRSPAGMLPRIQPGRSLAKTVTFRITVATMDFAWNAIILGEVATAAGLSALNLAVGPVFYFLHEAAWNLYGSSEHPDEGAPRVSITVLAGAEPGKTRQVVEIAGLRIDRALAKTIVYETLGTIAEFTVNYVVVGDFVTAAIITAPFAVLGPFIYLGHEKAWDYVAGRAQQPATIAPAS